jgi:REP element-mobilizing transposase RayT
MRQRRAVQLEMQAIVDAPAKKPTWGGARAGAGRKPMPGGPRHVGHRPRAKHAKSRPVHITLRARKGLPSFRHQLVHQMMLRVLARQWKPRRKYTGDFQVVHFSIQSNHLHVMVEATDKASLRSGVSGLVIAFAKRLAALLGTPRGVLYKVWSERYHSRELGSPREVRNALAYVFQNFKKHGAITHGDGIVDRYSSAPSFAYWHVPPRLVVPMEESRDPPPWQPAPSRTWLLATGWHDYHGPLNTNERPA